MGRYPDGWGIVLWDADDYAAVDAGIDVWRAAAGETAFFENPMTAPAAPAEGIIRQQAAMLERTERPTARPDPSASSVIHRRTAPRQANSPSFTSSRSTSPPNSSSAIARPHVGQAYVTSPPNSALTYISTGA